MFHRKKDEPIIESLMDIDFYKFTMGQLVFHQYPDVNNVYGLTNRTKKVDLANCIDQGQLREELDHVKTLKFNNSEIHYLRGTNEYGERMFKEDYLQFLVNLLLPEYYLEKQNGQYRLEFSGDWSYAIYWETLALAIITQLYSESQSKGLSHFEEDCIFAEGQKRLAEKIKILQSRPDITFSDFGTRRRFSRLWQEYVVQVLAKELPNQFLGTSNTKLAIHLGLIPMGTSAHELFMTDAALIDNNADGIADSQNRVLEKWWQEYGFGLSIALTDTFGSSFFFHHMTKEQAKKWKGLRQDSGYPKVFTRRAVEFYEKMGVDPTEKLIVFSDGLDVSSILDIANYCQNKIRYTFGWGTNLTNDLGLQTLSLVIKVISTNGRGTVKLSDNLAKAIGAPENIARYIKNCGYHRRYQQELHS